MNDTTASQRKKSFRTKRGSSLFSFFSWPHQNGSWATSCLDLQQFRVLFSHKNQSFSQEKLSLICTRISTFESDFHKKANFFYHLSAHLSKTLFKHQTCGKVRHSSPILSPFIVVFFWSAFKWCRI